MAEVKLLIPFDEIHGAIEKHGNISRQKKYRDEKGRIIHEGKQVKRLSRTCRNSVN